MIRIVADPNRAAWQPTAHNHMFIYLNVTRLVGMLTFLWLPPHTLCLPSQGSEYCVICRRQRFSYLEGFWGKKVADYKRWLEQRFTKENKDEEKRIAHVRNTMDVRPCASGLLCLLAFLPLSPLLLCPHSLSLSLDRCSTAPESRIGVLVCPAATANKQ